MSDDIRSGTAVWRQTGVIQSLTSDGLFEIASWKDKTAEALAWAASHMNPGIGLPPEPAAMTLAHIIGPDAPLMVQNFSARLRSGRLELVQAVMRRTEK